MSCLQFFFTHLRPLFGVFPYRHHFVHVIYINKTKKPNNLDMILMVFPPSNLRMKSFRIIFQCYEDFIGQADWIIRHPGLTLEYSSAALPLDGVDDKQKIDCHVDE